MKKTFTLITIFFLMIGSKIAAQDSLIVQTFTFDSIITRQATFKLPGVNEEFSKIIGKFRLKCDALTQHDKYPCGEWDYHAYLRYVKPEGVNQIFPKIAISNFGNFNTPADGIVMELSTSPIKDKVTSTFVTTTATSVTNTPDKEFVLRTGDTTLGIFKSHQFLINTSDFQNANIITGTNIGVMAIDANIVDTMRNVIIRYAFIDAMNSTIPNSYYQGQFDTLAVHSVISADNCIDGKLMLSFGKDLIIDASKNLIMEILCDVPSNSQNTFKGYRVNNRRTSTIFPYSSAVLNGEDSWIKGFPLPSISDGQNFTFEGWFKIDYANTEELNNAILFNLGNNITIRLGENDNLGRIYVSLFDNVLHSTAWTGDVALQNDIWTHIAVAYNGKGRTLAERLSIYVNGSPVSIGYAGYGVNGNAYVISHIGKTTSDFYIGKGYKKIENDVTSFQNNLIAKISQIRLWDISRTTEEIYADMNSINIPPNDNLLVDLRFNDDFSAREILNNASNQGVTAVGNIYFTSKNEEALSIANTRIFPNIIFYNNTYSYNIVNKDTTIERTAIPISKVYFSTDTTLNYPEITKIENYYLPSVKIYDVHNNIVSEESISTLTEKVTAGNEQTKYTEVIDQSYNTLEIGRFITPYGINLDLGENGFEWEYDFTDYMHILRGDVTLAIHNLQELIDLKLIYIKGEPTRDVLRIQEPWGQHGNNSYIDLINNTGFSNPKEVEILSTTKSVKLKTRITGHGMLPNTSGNTQCCEFFANTHYIYNGDTYDSLAGWQIWQECATNPVYPQGGTWILHREGWCPGDVVKEYDIELMPYFNNGKMKIDYDISNTAYILEPGTKDGYYTMSMQIIEYGASKYQNDLELYDVITPSHDDIYSRLNPICNGFKFIIRNNTDNNMNAIKYNLDVVDTVNNAVLNSISGEINLNKPLMPYTLDTLTITGFENIEEFWYYVSKDNTKVSITVQPKDGIDDNLTNNTIINSVNLPDIYDNNFAIQYTTNNFPQYYSLKVMDSKDEIVKTFSATAINREYVFPLSDLPDGCYTLLLEMVQDIYGNYYGLSFWNMPSIGSGSFKLINTTDYKAIKTFNPDFGKQIKYSFVINGFNSIKEDEKIILSIFPNPTENYINISPYETIQGATINIFDETGDIVYELRQDIFENQQVTIDISKFAVGAYSIRISKDNRTTWGKFIVK